MGVVGYIQQWGVDSDLANSVRAQLYTLAEQVLRESLGDINKGAGIVVQTQASNYPSIETIRSALRQMNSEQAPYDFHPMDEIVSESLAARRFAMILLAVFAALALALSSIGI